MSYFKPGETVPCFNCGAATDPKTREQLVRQFPGRRLKQLCCVCPCWTEFEIVPYVPPTQKN